MLVTDSRKSSYVKQKSLFERLVGSLLSGSGTLSLSPFIWAGASISYSLMIAYTFAASLVELETTLPAVVVESSVLVEIVTEVYTAVILGSV